MAGSDDDTVKLVHGVEKRDSNSLRMWLIAAILVGVVLAGAAGLWWWWPRKPDSQLIAVRTADEVTIRDNHPTNIDAFRFSLNQKILVLDFATLKTQAAMLNRVAAMSEKLSAPHDRALTDPELDGVIRAGGDTPETFYYGHDYSAAELSTFFAATDREKLTLTPEESWLRGFLHDQGFDKPGAQLALITIPAAGTTTDIDASGRATILHHELSHGEFFTNPDYRNYVWQFWTKELTQSQRENFQKFLVSENYDPALAELIVNETQAYLMFTPDPRFFTPGLCGLNDAGVAALRQRFRDGMPQGWLHEVSLADAAARSGG